MANYALLNENNEVINVITGIDENNLETLPEGFSSWEEFYGDLHKLTCKRTSRNTVENTHVEGGTAFRGNYAIIGGLYDPNNDVFYLKQPFSSWTLNKSNWKWEAPVAYPDDEENNYIWNESNQEWELFNE
tara:strand:+ start:334 stop:726 length:393 start_codon:yes stop_codon:yes gene_type:complete